MMGRGANATVPPSLAGMAFSMDNVKGTTWGYNTMMTSGTMGWEHGTLSFDSNGLGHMTGIVRNGSPLSDRDNIPYTMSLSGMLLNPGDNTFQSVVSRDMSVMVATFTDSTGGPAMMIAQKRGGVYQAGGLDMNGTWRFQRLTAGSDNTTSGWAYGTMGIISGIASITSMTTNNGPGTVGNFCLLHGCERDHDRGIERLFLRRHVDGQVHDRGHGYQRGPSRIVGHDENHSWNYLLRGRHDGGLGDAFGILRQYRFPGLDLRTLVRGSEWEQHILPDDGEHRGDLAEPTQMTMEMNGATGVMTIPGTGGGRAEEWVEE